MHLSLFILIAFCLASSSVCTGNGEHFGDLDEGEYEEEYYDEEDDEDDDVDDDDIGDDDEEGPSGDERDIDDDDVGYDYDDNNHPYKEDDDDNDDDDEYENKPYKDDDDKDDDRYPYGEEDYEDYSDGICSVERKRLERVREENKSEDSDLFLPECTNQGEFHLRQCHLGQCWCVDPQGGEVEGSRKDAVGVDGGPDFNCDEAHIHTEAYADRFDQPSSNHPAFLVAVIMLAVLGLTGAVMVSMFVVYRMRKKDEGSYALANNNHNNNNILISSNNNCNNGFDGKRTALINNNYIVKDAYPPQQQQQNAYNYNLPQQQHALQQEFYA